MLERLEHLPICFVREPVHLVARRPERRGAACVCTGCRRLVRIDAAREQRFEPPVDRRAARARA
jgi:hypothetical protein